MARADEAAPPTTTEPGATWPLLGALGCRGGGDPFVGVELSDERPESSPSSPPAPPFSRPAWTTRVRVGRPLVRLLAPFELSGNAVAILGRQSVF